MIEIAKKTLENGKLVIFPTETVYGLGADATNIKAIKSIYKVKNRPIRNPLICHFKNFKQVSDNFKINKLDKILIDLFWPGPLTIILRKKKSSKIKSLLSNNKNFVGCRIPKNKIAISLLNSISFPIAAPSANLSTKISTTQPNHISKELKKVSYILKGGSSKIGLESTVIKTFKNTIKILRLGSITIEEISKKLPGIKIKIENYNSKISPGNQLKHYSPNLPIRINISKVKKNESLINFGKNKLVSNICEYNLSPNSDLKEASKNLFNYLHLIDKYKCAGIAVAPIPNKGLGKTINDRLIRASIK